MLALILISFIIVFLIIYYVYKKQAKNDLEKVLVIVLGTVTIAILVLWYLDKYNIPTAEWFDFIINFLVTMLATFISALLVLATTIGQIERGEENDQETHRINNMPFLEYKISITNNTLNIKLKNIGNNTINRTKLCPLLFNLSIWNYPFNSNYIRVTKHLVHTWSYYIYFIFKN